MKELKERITENGIDYVLIGDYYFPDFITKDEPATEYENKYRQRPLLQYNRKSDKPVTGGTF